MTMNRAIEHEQEWFVSHFVFYVYHVLHRRANNTILHTNQCHSPNRWQSSSSNMTDRGVTVSKANPGSNLTMCLSWLPLQQLQTLTAVPRSTQPSTLHGMVKWVSVFGLSNNNKQWWWMVAAYWLTRIPSQVTWFENWQPRTKLVAWLLFNIPFQHKYGFIKRLSTQSLHCINQMDQVNSHNLVICYDGSTINNIMLLVLIIITRTPQLKPPVENALVCFPCSASPSTTPSQRQSGIAAEGWWWVGMHLSAYFGKRLHGMLSWTHVHV